MRLLYLRVHPAAREALKHEVKWHVEVENRIERQIQIAASQQPLENLGLSQGPRIAVQNPGALTETSNLRAPQTQKSVS